jgi:hypothetical protein
MPPPSHRDIPPLRSAESEPVTEEEHDQLALTPASGTPASGTPASGTPATLEWVSQLAEQRKHSASGSKTART